MTDLATLTALGDALPRSVTHGALTLRENAGLALASLALRDGADQPRPLGLNLPGPGNWTAAEGLAALWTGPGQWLIEAGDAAPQDLAGTVAAASPGCSVTDQTDAWVAFEIASATGDAPIRALMARLVNIDASRFGPGSSTRTGLDHMGVIVIRRAADRLAVLGTRSTAGSLWHALETAARRLALSRPPDHPA